MPTASRASEWSLLPASFQTGWPALQRAFPGVQAKFRWGRVHAIYGRPFGGGRTPLQSANNFISEFGGDLFGIDSNTELVLDRVVEPAIGEGPAYVHFHQEYAGRPLDGAHLSLTIANRAGYPITLASGFIHPSPGAYMRGRQRTREQTIQIARDLFGQRNVSIDRITEVIWPLGHAPEYGWAMNVTPADAPDDAERITVGTFDGRVLRRTNLIDRFGDYTATVKGDKSEIEQEPPECDIDPPTTEVINLADAKVEAVWLGGSATGQTDANGQVTLSGVPATFDVTASLENLQFKFVDRSAGNPPPLRIETGNETDPIYNFVDNDDWPNTVQMINAWKWLNFAKDWVVARDSSYSLGSQLNVRCNGDDCQASYGRILLRLNYSNRNTSVTNCGLQTPCACGGCTQQDPLRDFTNDFQYNTIIVHEYGHHLINEEYQGVPNISPTYNENMSDTISGFITGESKMGAKLCECADWLVPGRTRDIDNTWVWPRFVANKYPSGLPFSGAYWDMRVDLTDNDLAGKILLHGIKKHPIGVDPAVGLHAVLVDDDSGVNGSGDDDISNGSPNYETINAAFRKHGLATDNVAYLDIDWYGISPGDVADDEDLAIKVAVDEGTFTIDAVELRYRINDGGGTPGAWIPKTMAYNLGQDHYYYTIKYNDPIRNDDFQVGDVIDFYVRVDVSDTNREYTCFPTQAQFDWSTPNGDNIPEERDFFSVLVTDSVKVEAVGDDLQTDPSWVVGTDEWEWGAPNLEDFGQQPGNDYPFDSDASSGGTAPNCYFTSAADAVGSNETWSLTIEDIDLSQLDGENDKVVISYALWFYVRGGRSTDKFTVEIWDGTSWSDPPIDIVTATGVDGKATALQRWIRRRVTVTDVNLHGPGKKLRFSATRSAGSGGTIEAVVDEVRAWGVIDD